jgi:3-hydroxyisobutyrate dehydrogenase
MGTPHYMGDAGKGQHTKMANQILIARFTIYFLKFSGMIAVCEGLIYGHKAGIYIHTHVKD